MCGFCTACQPFLPPSDGLQLTYNLSSFSSLGPSALKAAGTAPTVKRKETPNSGQPKEKKKKSALDEIMEVQ